MEETIDVEFKMGELLRNDMLRELDALQTVSSSLLMLDLKRKHIESHFDSLAKMIERKRDEAIEAIRVRDERRSEELRMKEVRVDRLRKGVFGEIFVRSRGIDVEMERMERFEERLKVWEEEIARRDAEMEVRENEIDRRGADVEVREKEVERRGAEVEVREKEVERLCVEIAVREKETERRCAEFEVKEKEMDEVKMYVERLCAGLTRKEREISGLNKVVDELKVDGERHDAEFRKLADENRVLRGKVKLLTDKLEVKSKVPGQEEQLEAIKKFLHVLTTAGIVSICNPTKESELSGRELLNSAKDSFNDQGAAISKVSSLLLEAKDNAPALVVEALKISYLSESEEKNNKSLLAPCRILLLEHLSYVCPERKSQVRNEALKVSGEWSAQIKRCGLKPVEISRFLQFLSIYDIASEFSDDVLIPMLYYVAAHEGTPDFCFTVEFTSRITGYIKTLVKNDQRLKALNYVTTFKMAKEISIMKIIQRHLKGLENNCQKMLKDGEDRKAAEVQVLDLQIATLKELIKCVKDLKLESIYTTGNLEERLANLEKQKYHNKRLASCSEPSSDPEPPRKKGCNLSETTKSPKPDPSISIGLRVLYCSGAKSDYDSVAKNICKFPEMVKSAEATTKASDAYPQVKSGDSLSNNSNNLPEPQRKKECKFPGTPKLLEAAKNIPNANPETESKDVVSSTNNSDAEPLRSKGYNLHRTDKLMEVAPTTPNAHPNVSRKVLSLMHNNNPEPSRNIGCTLPRPAKPDDISPKGTLIAYPEIKSSYLLSSNSNNCLQLQRKNECKLPRMTKLMEVDQNTSNVIPESRDIFCSKPQSYPEPLRSKVYELPGTAKLSEVVLNAKNAYPKTVPRDVLCSKPNINPEPRMNKRCNFHELAKSQEVTPKSTFFPVQFCYGAPASSPYSSISSRPPSYQPPLPTYPPQQYPPRPQSAGNLRPQVPCWNYSVPNRPPCFDYRR